MVIKGTKSIAEYRIVKWLREQGFQMDFFTLSMEGNEGGLTDQCGENLILVYDPATGSVKEKEGRAREYQV